MQTSRMPRIESTEPETKQETIYIDTCDVAKMIRKSLKQYFPKTKFSVKSKKYSGGSSITVYWTNGPTTDKVEGITKHFEGASFDGMIDLKSYKDANINGQKVSFGSDYVFSCREITDDVYIEKVNYIIDNYADCQDWPKAETIDDVFGSGGLSSRKMGNMPGWFGSFLNREVNKLDIYSVV